MRVFLLTMSVAALTGCGNECGAGWAPLPDLSLTPDARVTLDLRPYVDAPADATLLAESSESGVLANVDAEGRLAVVAASGFVGEATITLRTDACDAEGSVRVVVGDPDLPSGDTCPVTVRYPKRGNADAAFVAGTFNAWEPRALPMTLEPEDMWSVTLDLPPGQYPYKVVETDAGGGGDAWACNPLEPLVQCDEGYTWDPSCTPGGAACNSLLEVPDCTVPRLHLERADANRDADTFAAEVRVEGETVAVTATLDGEVVGSFVGDTWTLPRTRLADGRHTLQVSAVNVAGASSEVLHVPFWLDDRTWQGGLMYYVFVDRYANGDPSLDGSEGTTAASTDYVGGDWQGVIDRMDELAEMGVTVLWLTAPQDNAEGAWGGSCGQDYSGYHGYWPSSASGLEEHFGDEAKLRELIAAAHARGIRVLADWVGNHVHQDHPYYTDHPEWFNEQRICGDANNWNDIPETCWFDGFLPDVRYYDTAPLVTFVDDAIDFAKRWDLDGYRVDAVKHMPSSVFHNFAARARTELEGVEDFYTVGETYTGDRDLILRYVGPTELDGQFDFPLYWATVAAFARDEAGLSNGAGSLEQTWEDSRAAWGDALMSTFLGNHDVARFIAQASGDIGSLYGDSSCGPDGLRTPDTAPGWGEPYRRLEMAWAFLLTSEGLPLVYYGDEIGLPGYNDPDNRQSMRFGENVSPDEERVRALVGTLGRARLDHPALWSGTRTPWWQGESDAWAYARVAGDDAALVVFNRGDISRTFTNGVSFAGLPQGGYRDVSTGEVFMTSGDSLSVDVPALTARVLVHE